VCHESADHRQQQLDKQSDLSEIPRAQHRPKAKSLYYYAFNHKDRNVAMFQAYSTGDYTMKAIATHFNVHYATVSRAIKKAELNDV
jgi:DNA-binding MarR family transcriptional regulator